MKKIVSFCMLIVTILSYLVVINVYRSKDYDQLVKMGQTPDSFKIYIQNSNSKPDDEIDFFEYLAKKYNTSFILTTNGKGGIIEKSVIAADNTFPAASFRLNKVDFSNKHNFYASYQSHSDYQKGIIPTFSKKNKIKLQTLNSFFNKDRQNVDGVYTVIAPSANKSVVLKQLSQYFNVPTNKLLTPTSNFHIGYANENLYILLFAILISVLVVILITVYLPISRVNSIGIHKLNGWSNGSVFLSLIKMGLLTILISAIALDVLSLFIFKYRPDGFLLMCILVQISLIILYLLSNSFAFLLIKKMTIADLLKNRYHFNLGIGVTYLLKLLMTITTIVLLIAMSSSINSLIKQYSIQQKWQNNGDVITLNTSSASALNNEDEANKRMLAWYKSISKNKGVYYINSQNYKVAEILPNNSNSIDLLNKDDINVMTVNHNFLKDNYADLNDKKADFLVPAKFRGTKIKYLLQCFKYNELSSKEQDQLKPSDVKIKIKYYNRNISPITYNPNLGKVFNNPIIEIIKPQLTDYQISTLLNTDKNSPIKIKNTVTNQKKIKSLNKQSKFKILNLKFTTLNSLLAASTEDISSELHTLLTVLIFTIILNIFTTTFLIFCVISEKQKELAVKRLLGYRRLDCYKYEFLFLLVLGAIEIVTLLLLKSNIYVILIAVLLTTVDLLVLYFIAGYLENKKLVFLLKGGLS